MKLFQIKALPNVLRSLPSLRLNVTVQNPRLIHNLALVGFMGTGKSSVGRLAADLLRFDFIDTDEWIESQTGKSIAEIFEQNGEAAFRLLEEDTARALSSRRNIVISAGGGFVANPDNLASLKSHALVICLWASPETIWERVRTQSHRPLLQTADPPGKIRELLEQRSAAYHQADAMIHTGFRSPKEVAQQVLHQFRLARK
ncbi:MAG TPA: shikimate kinase [Candidatus Baltobacteraceae bacterium]|nr:shikimate kinase [Candidatus Baltobacteraceae bacterium]